MHILYVGRSSPPYKNVRVSNEWNNQCTHCMAIKKCARRLFHPYSSLNKKRPKSNIICCNLCNFSIFQPSSRAQGFGAKFKRTKLHHALVPIDTESFDRERIAAENKYMF